MQESAATLLRGGAEQGEEPGRSPGPPSRDTGERGTALGGGSLSRALSRRASQRLCLTISRQLMERVRVELPGVPEGLTVYVTAYFPQADKGGERGELKLAVEAFGGVAVGKPRYGWMHKAIFNLPDASAAIKGLVTAYAKLKLC